MDIMDAQIIREKLVQAICKPVDDTKKIAVYGAGDTTLKYSPCFNVSGGGLNHNILLMTLPLKMAQYL